MAEMKRTYTVVNQSGLHLRRDGFDLLWCGVYDADRFSYEEAQHVRGWLEATLDMPLDVRPIQIH